MGIEEFVQSILVSQCYGFYFADYSHTLYLLYQKKCNLYTQKHKRFLNLFISHYFSSIELIFSDLQRTTRCIKIRFTIKNLEYRMPS